MILRRHMGRDLAAPQIIDECRHVIGLVRAQRAPALAGTVAVDQLKGGFAFRRARRDRHVPADHQTVAVLHQRMPHETQPAFPAIALAVKPGVRVGRAFMGLVGPLLAMKIPFRVAARASAIVSVLGTETLHRRPGLDLLHKLALRPHRIKCL